MSQDITMNEKLLIERQKTPKTWKYFFPFLITCMASLTRSNSFCINQEHGAVIFFFCCCMMLMIWSQSFHLLPNCSIVSKDFPAKDNEDSIQWRRGLLLDFTPCLCSIYFGWSQPVSFKTFSSGWSLTFENDAGHIFPRDGHQQSYLHFQGRYQ